jgi:hypothetical protein
MEHQRHFDTSEAEQREAVKIRKMIGDLDRSVRLLSCDIASEEERTKISDRSDATYSILARMLAIRRPGNRHSTAWGQICPYPSSCRGTSSGGRRRPVQTI